MFDIWPHSEIYEWEREKVSRKESSSELVATFSCRDDT